MRIPSTNKIPIINTILLGLVLALLIFLTVQVLKNNSGDNARELDEANSGDTTEQTIYPKQDSLPIDLEDLTIDSLQVPHEIISAISGELKDFNWNQKFQVTNLYEVYHQTILAEQFPMADAVGKRWIILTYSNFGHNYYHFAQGRTSLFEFQKEDKSWRMTRKYLAFAPGDEWGLEPAEAELVSVGTHGKYAVILHTSYSHMGHDKKSQWVYTEVNCAMNLVFDFTSYEYYNDQPVDFEYTEGYSEMRIVKSNKPWFDIETKLQGTDWNNRSNGGITRYVFDGKEYIGENDTKD